jgi:hypothetical protein
MNKVMNWQKIVGWLTTGVSQYRKLRIRCKRILHEVVGYIGAGLVITAIIAAAYGVTEILRFILGAAMAF